MKFSEYINNKNFVEDLVMVVESCLSKGMSFDFFSKTALMPIIERMDFVSEQDFLNKIKRKISVFVESNGSSGPSKPAPGVNYYLVNIEYKDGRKLRKIYKAANAKQLEAHLLNDKTIKTFNGEPAKEDDIFKVAKDAPKILAKVRELLLNHVKEAISETGHGLIDLYGKQVSEKEQAAFMLLNQMAEKIETFIKTGYQPKITSLDKSSSDLAAIRTKNQALYQKGKDRLQKRINRFDLDDDYGGDLNIANLED